jgi:hypothetical protein
MFRYQPTRALQRLTRANRPSTTIPTRFMSTTPTRLAAKDTQDKDSLNPQSTEYSKSGSDDSVAASDAAFNPSKTSPEEAEATAEKEAGGKDNSLNVSPGNEEISRPNDPGVGGTGGAPEKKSSGGGSAPKAGGGKSG